MSLPKGYDERKAIPLAAVFDYFPDALRAVAEVELVGSEQDADAFLQFFIWRGTGAWSACLARCALVMLQHEIEVANGVEPRCFEETGLAALFDRCGDALCEVARNIEAGQKQHGTTGWDRSKSRDEESTMLRHFFERGTIDSDGIRHLGKTVWRSLAFLQKEEEARLGVGISRGSYDSSKGQTSPTDTERPPASEPLTQERADRIAASVGCLLPSEVRVPSFDLRPDDS
jgi:hypothetical protein